MTLSIALAGTGVVSCVTEEEERPEDEVDELVRARRFEVLDERGNVLVAIAATPHGVGGIITQDAQGRPLVTIDSRGGTAVIGLNHEGRQIARLGGTERGSGALAVMNPGGEIVSVLGSDAQGCGVAETFDAAGENPQRLSGCTSEAP